MKGSRYSLFPIQFVPDTICSRYNMFPIQFVPDKICSRYNLCRYNLCRYKLCRYNLCRYSLYMNRIDVFCTQFSDSFEFSVFTHTANEGPVRILYKCLVPFIYSQKWNFAASLIPKQNYNTLSPNSCTLISVRDLYIYPGAICLLCCSQICGPRFWEYINRLQTHECENWDWGAIPAFKSQSWQITRLFLQ
jgi:hypothetical protein